MGETRQTVGTEKERFAESRFARKNLQESPFEVRKIRDVLNSESLKR